jgi:ppGpp synthetase/RelA/SpoT-type nucleotidyltranferase
MSSISTEYVKASEVAGRLEAEVLHQLESLVGSSKASLATPIEHRVKSLASILEKKERKSISAQQSLLSLPDLLGFRIVLLFRRDLYVVIQVIQNTFNIIESEDTAVRLSEGQFGYQSYHFICKIPKEWTHLPSFTGLGDVHFEIQVRTASQHIWAAASHKLQYKQESAVPLPLRRSIHRVAALLETVDLEFERVLNERELYTAHAVTSPTDALDVITIQAALSSVWPAANSDGDGEPYADLVSELKNVGITSQKALTKLLRKYRKKTLQEDKQRAEDILSGIDPDNSANARSRAENHVYFTHVGLTRVALVNEFGQQWHFDDESVMSKNKES